MAVSALSSDAILAVSVLPNTGVALRSGRRDKGGLPFIASLSPTCKATTTGPGTSRRPQAVVWRSLSAPWALRVHE